MSISENLCMFIATRRWLSKHARVALINVLSKTFMKNQEFETAFFGFRYRGNTANILDRKVLFSGCHECDALAFLRDAIAMSEKRIYIDIGANIGHHTLFMSRYATKVYAFEPYALVRRQLEDKLFLNQVSNVTIVPTALGNRNEQLRYFSPPDENTGMGSFVEKFSALNTEGEMLEIRIADELFPELGIGRADIIKMDVEGFEKQVLLGAQAVLETLRPVILFECSLDIDDGFRSYADVRAVFPEDYRLYRLSHKGKRRHGVYFLPELTTDMFLNRRQLTIVATHRNTDIPLEAVGSLEKSG